jgi:hypothetical protein
VQIREIRGQKICLFVRDPASQREIVLKSKVGV